MNRTLLSFLLLSWVLTGCDKQEPVDVVDPETRPPASSLLDLLDDSSGTTSSDANYATPVFLDVAQERAQQNERNETHDARKGDYTDHRLQTVVIRLATGKD